MNTRIYLSNLPREWVFARQERALKPFMSGAKVFRDELTAKDRMGRRREFLVARDKLLRTPTRGFRDETTIVAVLGVLDWTEAGLLDCIARLQDRGGVLRVIEPALEIGPRATTHELRAAVEAFHSTKHRKPKSLERGRAGAEESAQRRWGEAEAKVQIIKERWQIGDQRIYRTADLLAEAGVTRNTAIAHMDKRRGPP